MNNNNGIFPFDIKYHLILDTAFKGILLPMLKDLIRGRVRSSGYPCVSTIIKRQFHDDIFPIESRPKFDFDRMEDFRLALRIVSQNKIDNCFDVKEAYLCNELRKWGNIYVHRCIFSDDFVSNVLMTTKAMLKIVRTDLDIIEYCKTLEKIEQKLKLN